ncbi:MAG TPA: MarR family transcriptional regulator [Ktedonobacterales bacterium]|jgi:DNA-binding MarR family transcriptional regulator
MDDSTSPSRPKTKQALQSNLPGPATRGERGSESSISLEPGKISKAEFESLANFRYAIRRFLRFSEQEARKVGITPQQHQLLLAIKGYPDRESATVSDLAERLQMRQHSTVGLIDRTEAQGLVRREAGTADRRQVYIFLTPAGEALLDRLAIIHRRELHTMSDALQLPMWKDSSPPTT